MRDKGDPLVERGRNNRRFSQSRMPGSTDAMRIDVGSREKESRPRGSAPTPKRESCPGIVVGPLGLAGVEEVGLDPVGRIILIGIDVAVVKGRDPITPVDRVLDAPNGALAPWPASVSRWFTQPLQCSGIQTAGKAIAGIGFRAPPGCRRN